MVFNATYVGTTDIVFAFIRANYPAGATCICTNGTKTLYATDTSGVKAFGVTSPGTWTVSCPGTSVTPQSVSIPFSGEGMTYTVTLS